MADEAALWGDPATLCTLEELHAARAALQTYDDVLRTPLLPSRALTRTRTRNLYRCCVPAAALLA